MAKVSIQGLGKDHGATRVLGEVSLEIADGELLVLVGPSGCGKSTLLRCIAGLDAPTRGRIEIDGADVTKKEPRERDIAMVFQSYALYPHLTVRENLAFGLKMRKTPRDEIEKRVTEAAQMLELEKLLDRTPKQLSGGQRQRVAMGRAVVRRPRAFLFDEPLSNLDAALRGQMRVELMRLHQRLSATMIYVTHDQVEAMTLADRIAVLNGGVLQQVGPPDELYRKPANLFVARFIGMPEMNILPDNSGVRAEDVKIVDGTDAEVEVIEHLGWEALVHLRKGDTAIVARVEAGMAPRIGQKVGLRFENLHRFGSDGKTAVTAALILHVVLWHSYRADEERGLEKCVQVYNASHQVVVEAVAVPYDAYAYKLEAAIPRGNGPDLFVGKHDDVGEFSRAGLIEALNVKADHFLDGTVEPLRYGGKLWGLPLTFKSLALYYRRDKLPHPPRTTDELLYMATRVGFAYESGNMFYQAAWLHGFGGRFLDENNRPELNSQAAIRSLEFLRTLAPYLPEESTSSLAAQMFNEGQAAMTINGPWFTGEIAPGVSFGVAPLPIVSETGRPAAPLANMEAVMLAARARQPEAAIAFAEWLSSTEAAKIRALEGHQPVADRAAWEDARISGDPILSAFKQQLASTVPMSNAREMRFVWEPLQRALRRVLRGAADPKPALDEAQTQALESLRPAPPAVASTPYTLALGIALILLAVWSLRGARSGTQRFAWLYLAPSALAMMVLVFVPFAVGGGMSFFHYDAGGAVKWIFIGFRNFIDILASREGPIFQPLSFYYTLAVTALWTVANVALHVTLGVMLALLLRNPFLKLRGLYRVLLIVPWAVPNYITALIWKGMFHRQFGAINGLLALLHIEPVSWFSRFSTAFCANLATNVWLGFPFMMVVTLGALSRIPKELEEAAALDGATPWQRFRHVILPLLKPALLPSVLLGAVWTFNMFNVIFMVSGGEPDGSTEILVSQAYRWAFTRGHRYGYAAAYAVLIFAVLAIQSALSRRATPELDA